jgi:hypothetical protein
VTPSVVARTLTGYSAYEGLSPAVREDFCCGVIRIREMLARDAEEKQFCDQEQLVGDRDTLLAALPRVRDVLPAPDPDRGLKSLTGLNGLTGLKGLRIIDALLVEWLADYHSGSMSAAMMELNAFSVTVHRLLEVLPRIDQESDPYAVGTQFREVCLIRDLFKEQGIPLDYELAARVTACTSQEISEKAFRQRLRRGNRREWRRGNSFLQKQLKV